MSVEGDIRNVIGKISEEFGKGCPMFLASVVSVSGNGETCSVLAEGATWEDVRLTAVSDGRTNLHIKPAVGSYVICADLSRGGMSDLAVVMVSRIDLIEVGTAEHTAVKGDVLHSELDKLTHRVDTIIQAIKAATPTSGDGGAALKAAIVAALEAIPAKEDFSKIENDKIKHG